jgi:hypothetical protein
MESRIARLEEVEEPDFPGDQVEHGWDAGECSTRVCAARGRGRRARYAGPPTR